MRSKFWIFESKILLFAICLWQVISVYLIAVGVWPTYIAWVNLGINGLYIILSSPFNGLLLFILGLPLYIALPSSISDSFSMWRPLLALLGIRWFVEEVRLSYPDFLRAIRSKSIIPFIKNKTLQAFFGWETYLGLFFVIAFVSIIFARYKIHGLKQLIFLLNAYVIYIVCVYVIKNKEQILQVIRYLTVSLSIIVFFGYVQFIATFFTSIHTFWQYWASTVSRAYYGEGLSQVLAYSNSWFTPTEPKTLRMFSIMPDSHSFAMICVLLIACSLTLLYAAEQPRTFLSSIRNYWRHRATYILWSVIRFSGLAVILSGTRGMWVGLIPPFVVSLYLYIKNFSREMMKKIIISMLLIIFLFAIAPLINVGLNFIRFDKYKEDFLERAATIYNIREQSNLGFVEIWEHSVRYAVRHPFGIGYGNFIASITPQTPRGTKYKDVALEKNYRYNLPQRYVSAHSLYLHILVEVSIVGLVAFLAFWVQYYVTVWAFLKSYKDVSNQFTFFVLTVAITFLWFLAYGVFDVTLFNDKVLLYSLVCLSLSGTIIKLYKETPNPNL